MFFQLVINSMIIGTIYALIALGFNLVYSTTKFFNLAHGVFAAIGAYAVFFLYTTSGMNLYLSVSIGVLITGIIGMLSDKLLFMPLRKRHASNVTLLVASLGLFTTLQSILAMLFSNRFQTLTDIFVAQKTFRILGAVVTDVHMIIFITVALTVAALILMINKTRFGKAVKAISDEEDVAKVLGINTDRIIGYVFLIGSSIAGIGGILVGFDSGIMPTMGMELLLKGVTASIIGGVGNIYGGVVGAVMLGFLENFGTWKIPGEWKDSIAFGLLIIFLLFRPRGIFSK